MAPYELCAALAKSGRPDAADDVEVHDVEMDGCSSDDGAQLHSADSQDETETEAPPLQRTATQLQKQAQVRAILSRAGTLQDAVKKLRAAVECLAKEELLEDADADAAQRLKAAVDDERKRARNIGEDLTQDLLSLDKLSGLVPEDRACRKAAIAAIEALLDDIDAAKSVLVSLDGKIAALQSRAGARQTAAAEAAAPPPVMASTSEPSAPSKPARQAQHAAPPHSARAPDASRFDMAGRFEDATRPPSADVWAGLELPLRLHAREEEGRYVITLPTQDLNPEEVDLKLDVDERTLTIRVLRLPRADEAAQMQRRVAVHLQQLAARSAGHRAQVVENMEDLARRSYVSLGEGAFGLFEKSVQIPEDADVAAIRSICSDGVLRVVLPKRLQRSAAPRGYGYDMGGYHNNGAGWRGYHGRSRARPAAYEGFRFGGFPF